ncbi:hypothetical protein [uncultured Duncaniella sp.]|uniref:hypothetical protein n=1 Tax=uncultured Duncaniella sp. TaxID=2768039 RepID=UPI0026087054|nr:hypothetical protein [uncultured Duncaniella sp.]
MKRTTYMMLGAFICGLLLVSAFSFILLTGGRDRRELDKEHEFGGSKIEIPLPESFSSIAFELEDDDSGFRIGNFKGIAVEVSDSVTAPVLRANTAWRKILNISTTVDTLNVRINLMQLYDSIKASGSLMDIRYLDSSESWPLTVVVPRSMTLKNMRNSWNSILLSNLSSEKMTVAVYDRLVLDSCHIDTLHSTLPGLEELKLVNSTVNQVSLTQPSGELRVKCIDSSSSIGKIIVEGDRKSDSSLLNLTSANFGTVKWTLRDSTAKMNIRVHKPAELVSGK